MIDERTTANDDRPGLFHYESAAERVTDRERIAGIMKSLMLERSVLTVTVPGVNARYLSTVLKADHERGLIWLDELAPRGGHNHLVETGKIHVHASLRGSGIHFKAELDGTGEKDGVAWYRMPMPDLVHHLQRRAWYRVAIGAVHPVAMHIEPLPPPPERAQGKPATPYPSTAVHGRVYDISIGGSGMLLPRDTELKRGDPLERCMIDIPGESPLVCRVELRHAHQDTVANMIRAGGRFLDLAAHRKHVIEHFGRVRERENLRRHAEALHHVSEILE